MRTLGSPSASTVASDMAVGSRGSPFTASSNQAANSRNGSSASVKSPVVNQVGCSIGGESVISRSHLGGGVSAKCSIRVRRLYGNASPMARGVTAAAADRGIGGRVRAGIPAWRLQLPTRQPVPEEGRGGSERIAAVGPEAHRRAAGGGRSRHRPCGGQRGAHQG